VACFVVCVRNFGDGAGGLGVYGSWGWCKRVHCSGALRVDTVHRGNENLDGFPDEDEPVTSEKIPWLQLASSEKSGQVPAEGSRE
jgi:hypothetical protein